MDQKRLILYFALAFVVFSLWTNWLKDYPTTPVTTPTTTAPASTSTTSIPVTTSTNGTAGAPAATTSVPSAPAQTQPTSSILPVSAERLVEVNTDVLNVKIDTLGGNIVYVSLPKYPAQIHSKDAVVILNPDPATYYVAQSGVTGPQGPDTPQGQIQYKTAQSSYTLQPDQNNLNVVLTWKNPAGLMVTKIFRFQRDNYAVHLDYNIQNHSRSNWSGNIYSQLRRKPQPKKAGLFQFSTFEGAAISSAENPYQKISYSKMEKENLTKSIRGGWLAMQQRYFLSAWVPNQQQANQYYTSVDPEKIYTIGYIGQTITMPPQGQFNTTTTLYVGPELEDRLKAVAAHLDLTIDFGWLWWLSVPILWVMERIYKVVGNWGWSIVLVTLLIKLLFYKFSEMSYRSMAKMRQLQPKLAELKEKYGDDRQKMSQATMELYRKEKVNPLGGCLPILVQIPVFIALYYVLIESVQLRHAPWILWIHDLSAPDPYFILPILMGISMFLQQRLNPTPPDPIQARVMQFLPIMFTIFFATFPSGLVLYWLTNNVLSILQQWHITRSLEKKIANKIHKIEEKFEHKKPDKNSDKKPK